MLGYDIGSIRAQLMLRLIDQWGQTNSGLFSWITSGLLTAMTAHLDHLYP